MRATTKLFAYDKGTKTFFQEMSTLEGNADESDPSRKTKARSLVFHQVYPDACDEGMTLVSARTGEEVDYVVIEQERAVDGELESWTLVPTKQALKRVPRARGTKIIIWND